MTTRIHAVFSIASSAVVIGAIIGGFLLVGSPGTTRLARFDKQRLEDLQTIVREIQSLCRDPEKDDQLKHPLPDTLEELARQARHERIHLTDPETGERYVYNVTGKTTYELCAEFSLERDSDANVFWNHSPGQHCFAINVLDPL